MPLIATVVAAPYYAVVGFVAGRRRDVTVGAVVGAAVAGIGFLVLCAAILVVPIDATGAWRDSGARLRDVLLVGPVFLVSVVAVGLVCGVSGAALAHARFTGESAREE